MICSPKLCRDRCVRKALWRGEYGSSLRSLPDFGEDAHNSGGKGAPGFTLDILNFFWSKSFRKSVLHISAGSNNQGVNQGSQICEESCADVETFVQNQNRTFASARRRLHHAVLQRVSKPRWSQLELNIHHSQQPRPEVGYARMWIQNFCFCFQVVPFAGWAWRNSSHQPDHPAQPRNVGHSLQVAFQTYRLGIDGEITLHKSSGNIALVLWGKWEGFVSCKECWYIVSEQVRKRLRSVGILPHSSQIPDQGQHRRAECSVHQVGHPAEH